MRNSQVVFSAGTKLAFRTFAPILVIASLLIIFKPDARAVPSYSRQTGLPALPAISHPRS